MVKTVCVVVVVGGAMLVTRMAMMGRVMVKAAMLVTMMAMVGGQRTDKKGTASCRESRENGLYLQRHPA